MSMVRITEFTGRPASPAGEWYAVDGREGSICIERGAAAATAAPGDGARSVATGMARPDTASGGAGHVSTTWTGVRTSVFGSRQKGPVVFMLKYPVPLDYLYEFEAWFQFEHMPMLLEEPTWYGCEFYRALGASCYAFAALHYLEPQALQSDARNRSVDTPWWHRLKQHEWFDKQFIRTLMKPIGDSVNRD